MFGQLREKVMKFDELKCKNLLCCIFLFLTTFAIHMIYLNKLNLDAPMYVDEYRTFLTGAFLSGRYDLSLLHAYESSSYYYGWGQVILYIPLFYLCSSYVEAFKCALVVNAIIMSIVPCLIFQIFKKMISNENIYTRTVFALMCGLYPPLLYASKTVTNETLLMFLPILILYILSLFSEENRKIFSILLSFTLGLLGTYAYITNTRGIVVLAATTICVVFIVLKRKKYVSGVSYLLGVAIVYIINKIVKSFIISDFHQPMEGSAIRNSTVDLLGRIKALMLDKIVDAIILWSGNLLYVIVVTGGISIVLCIAWLFKSERKKNEIQIWFAILCIGLQSVMMLFIDFNLYAKKEALLIDYYIYGRYSDMIMPMILVVAIGTLINMNYSKMKCIVSAVVCFVVMIYYGQVYSNYFISTGSNDIRVLNIGTMTAFMRRSFIDNPQTEDFVMISRCAVLVMIFFIVIKNMKKNYIVAFLGIALYLYATNYVVDVCQKTVTLQNNRVNSLQEQMEPYQNVDDEYKVLYYLYEGGTNRGVNMQYALAEWKVAQVDMVEPTIQEVDQVVKENSFVLSLDENIQESFQNKLIPVGEINGMILYAYGDELLENMEENIWK